MSKTLIADVTINDGADFTFPEQALPALQARPSVALCFSGGGTRSTTASTGYLRGLTKLGLIEKVRYISSVSGGSFASAVFTYYRSGPSDDAELLGPTTAPKDITEEALAADMPAQRLLSVCTTDLRSFIRPALHSDPGDQVWRDIAGQVVLAPFGLYDPQLALTVTLPERLPHILQQNPGLPSERFVAPRPGRPYLVVNACLVAPSAVGTVSEESPVTLQFSPIYTGSPLRRTLRLHPRSGGDTAAAVGGGLIETFAWGGTQPAALSATGPATLPAPGPGVDLALSVAASSAAFAGVLESLPIVKKLSDLAPEATVWPVQTGPIPAAQPWRLADGGVLENYGLLAMMQRKVSRAVVFINTNTRISDDIDLQDPDPKDIDVSFPPLFGFEHKSAGRALQNNTVFSRADFATVVQKLLRDRRKGRPMIAIQKHQIQANAWWGIEGGWEMTIAWVYLDRVTDWEDRLTDNEVKRAIKNGNRLIKLGPVKNFPNYKTATENGLHITELTPYQARLMADLTCWTITSNADLFTRFIENA